VAQQPKKKKKSVIEAKMATEANKCTLMIPMGWLKKNSHNSNNTVTFGLAAQRNNHCV
jgi:hypothetical protein